jgi:phosphoenolpyruvate carboxylase
MSTQHPDNVSPPPWTHEEVLAGDSEIEETFYAFSELSCQEQMWDWEGKDADPNVVRKLLSNYPDYFKTHRLGKDVFLTLRIANPSVEKTEQKAVIEALASIPRSYDSQLLFSGYDCSNLRSNSAYDVQRCRAGSNRIILREADNTSRRQQLSACSVYLQMIHYPSSTVP